MQEVERFEIHELPGAIAEAGRALFNAKRELKAAREKVAELRRDNARAVARDCLHTDPKARSLEIEAKLDADSRYRDARIQEAERERAREATAVRLHYLEQCFALQLAEYSAGKAQVVGAGESAKQ
jgi:hypothetical protein